MSRDNLNPGSFYWVVPVWDVDFKPPGFEKQEYSDAMYDAMAAHWSQNKQPARFEGYDDSGQERWIFLGQDVDADSWWPVRWIGDEIA